MAQVTMLAHIELSILISLNNDYSCANSPCVFLEAKQKFNIIFS